MSTEFQHRYILGKRVFAINSITELVQFLGEYKGILIAMNAIKLMNKDSSFTSLVNNNFSYSDGIGSVIALKKCGLQTIRVPGVELWLQLIDKYNKEKSVYIIGSTLDNITKAVNKLKSDYPELDIKGYHSGYFNDDEAKLIFKEIHRTKPDFIFVAMGSPRQELFINTINQDYEALYMGLGGSIDVYVGAVKRAPQSWIRLNLEWAYRLLKQPKRFFVQWVIIKFIFRLVTNKLKL